ncbi:T9SS type A sorting domain-containing protein [Neolewinella lacunae]|uniref:T9SS type A sorting domain-containing protein n=1 Tax=Neolewinella lacunae TaxID=1517758 RepID=A0A923PIK1_9BACT|nr:T9SS type A sorting domain-containing protein [Neolewinella lacunae]MBC6993351.1 T9SS type A sorting domain-containing protein [Neolewinella lacunae]MDN3636341.1 T9SS type A sorting domain-containing protein [Neolewinella lacunae]
MKTFHVLSAVVMMLLSSILYGQSFSIPIYFEDAIGNRDTIVLGYAADGGYGIDPELGEVDLLDSAYVRAFEVRASIYDYDKIRDEDPRVIESKKMVIGYVCTDPSYFSEANSIMAVIKCDNWPITLTWDKSKFQETCDFMNIVDCTPGGWFDVCGGGHPFLNIEMEETDTVMYYDAEFKIEAGEDTLSALFFPYGGVNILSVAEQVEKGRVVPYPNPVNTGVVNFKFNDRLYNESNLSVRIYNNLGALVSTSRLDEEITTQGWSSGLYLFKVSDGSKVLQTGKLLVVR